MPNYIHIIFYFIVFLLFIFISVFIDRIFFSDKGFCNIFTLLGTIGFTLWLFSITILYICYLYPNIVTSSLLIFFFIFHTISMYIIFGSIFTLLCIISTLDFYLKKFKILNCFGVDIFTSNIFNQKILFKNKTIRKYIFIFSYTLGVGFIMFFSHKFFTNDISNNIVSIEYIQSELDKYYKIFITTSIPIILSILKI